MKYKPHKRRFYSHTGRTGTLLFHALCYAVPRKEEDQLIAEDIWQTIRHELWKAHGSSPDNWIASQPALNLSQEPLPKISEGFLSTDKER